MDRWALGAEEAIQLADASGGTRERARDTALLAVCIDAGLRRHEVVALLVGDVDTSRWTLTAGGGTTRRVVRLGHFARRALQTFVVGRSPAEVLLVSRARRPVSDRVVHEQLRRLGELAGLGEWVTCRHTRRTFLASVAPRHDLEVVLRLMGHAGDRRSTPASIEEALEAQFGSRWASPLDDLLASVRTEQALAA